MKGNVNVVENQQKEEQFSERFVTMLTEIFLSE